MHVDTNRPRRKILVRNALAVLLLIASLALPLFLDGFLVFQLTLALISILAVLGLNILMGYTGQISLGHGAFYALGAYLTAIFMQTLVIPYWAAIPISGLACFIAGFLFGLPALPIGLASRRNRLGTHV